MTVPAPTRIVVVLALAAAAMAHAGPVSAEGVVIYRCTDAQGRLTVQNDTPCPKGSKQERRVMEPVPTGPFPMAPTGTEATIPPAAASAASPEARTDVRVDPVAAPTDAPRAPMIADADRLPPPILFECRTYDAGRYLTETVADLPQRCKPLATTALSGFGEGAGEACEMVADQCQRVPDEQLCEQWNQRLREVRSQARFGRMDLRGQAQAEVERIGTLVRDSTCGLSG